MLTFTDGITPAEHDSFVKSSPLCNLLQSSSWAKVKDNWGHAIVGAKEDGALRASALVLLKRMPLGLCAMYVPRGPILDYTDSSLVSFFFTELKKWAKKRGCVFIKFDPAIPVREFAPEEKDTCPRDPGSAGLVSLLENQGAVFRGFTEDMYATAQPRYVMGVHASDDFEASIARDARKSKNAAEKKHVEVRRYGEEKLGEFAALMQLTADRKDIYLRDENYFRKIMDAYGSDAYLFLSSVDPHVREREILERLPEVERAVSDPETPHGTLRKLSLEKQNLENELEAMKDVLAKYRGNTYVAGALMVGFGSSAEMLYAGLNEDFRSFKPQYLSHYVRFRFLFDRGYSYVSMGGVEGSLDDGLTKYKSKFGAKVTEYVGEFDLPVNRLLYRAYRLVYKS